MNTRIKNSISILFAVATISAGFIGCGGTKAKYLKPEVFMQRARTYDTSVSAETYIGKSRKRIYYELETTITLMGILGLSDKPAYIIFWTDLEKIPKEFIDKLEVNKDFKNEEMSLMQQKVKNDKPLILETPEPIKIEHEPFKDAFKKELELKLK